MRNISHLAIIVAGTTAAIFGSTLPSFAQYQAPAYDYRPSYTPPPAYNYQAPTPPVYNYTPPDMSRYIKPGTTVAIPDRGGTTSQSGSVTVVNGVPTYK